MQPPQNTQQLLHLLECSPQAISSRSLSVRLRLGGEHISDYQTIKMLRQLFRQGLVEFEHGRWKTVGPLTEKTTSSVTNGYLLPHISPTPPKKLGIQPAFQLAKDSPESNIDDVYEESGRWAPFRKLLRYYRHCIRSEEGADALAYQNQLGERFLYLRRSGSWLPRPGLPWRMSIPLGPHLAPFVGALPAPQAEETLVLGYPVWAFFKAKAGEPDVSLVRPIFYFQVEHSLTTSGIVLRLDATRPEVNLGWLESAFRLHPERRNAFLSACGFIEGRSVEDGAPEQDGNGQHANLETLTHVLEAVMRHSVCEPLEPHAVPDTPIPEPFETGIYNRAVLMTARRARYTQTLLKELRVIEATSDEELDRTALAQVFAIEKKEQPKKTSVEECIHEEIVIETRQLNAEQRRAVASLLTQPVSVITGPPGTGKSQVVACAAENARLKGQSVLFAGRNHRAIDAVMGRLPKSDGHPLMVRANSKDDPNLKVTFDDAIEQLLAEHGDPSAAERLAILRQEIDELLVTRGKQARYARQIAKVGGELGLLEERLAILAHDLPPAVAAVLEADPRLLPTRTIRNIDHIIHSLRLNTQRPRVQWLLAWWRAFALLPWYPSARKRVAAFPGLPNLPLLPSPASLLQLADALPLFEKTLDYSEIRLKCFPKEKAVRSLPSSESVTQSIAALSKRLAEIAPQAVALDNRRRQGLPEDCDREELDAMRAAMRSLRTDLEQGQVEATVLRLLRERAPYVLGGFPCWAVTNLSIGSRLPLIPALFDLAIIDEASQSDIPSAIPVLFRAKRVGVVGDPAQLSPITKLSTARDTLLRREVGLNSMRDVRFAYSENSLYNIVAGTNGVNPIFLSDTYRSADAIAAYSSEVFYGGNLRVATNKSSLNAPKGIEPGIHWTEVQGSIESCGGSGCYCTAEIEAVVSILRTMILDNGFKGSVGVVTPFAQQKRRLEDTLFGADTEFYHALEAVNCHVDTAHGFQGDERDVIIFSLCGGPDMPRGSMHFLRESGNLFNVAASRARAVLHVVGNRPWAKGCGILHVERLATSNLRSSGTVRRGPWYPHESPWEKILNDALVVEGLDPRPQFPVSGRRLDLALVPEGAGVPIDVEVDGDCHRNPDGSRKIDDVWRDIQLQGIGWKVLRFWTYQLRENIQGCVNTVLAEWRRYE